MGTCPQPLSPPQGLVRILSLSFLYPHHLLEFSVSIRTHSRTAHLKRHLDSTSSSSYQLMSLPLFMGNVFKRIVYTRRACFPTSLCIFIPICLLSPPLQLPCQRHQGFPPWRTQQTLACHRVAQSLGSVVPSYPRFLAPFSSPWIP